MGVYGEGIGGKLTQYNFKFQSSPAEIKEIISPVTPSLPVLPEAWPSFGGTANGRIARPNRGQSSAYYHLDQRREILRLERNRAPASRSSGIALQVHGEGISPSNSVRYRNIRVKKITPVPTTRSAKPSGRRAGSCSLMAKRWRLDE